MARLQWCRKHIKEVAEACDLKKSAVYEVEQAAEFCDAHSDFSELPTKPIITLIRVQDEQVRERAILHAQNKLNRQTPTGGQHTKTLTEKDIKKIIETAQIEIRNAEVDKLRAEEDAEEERTGIKNITQDEINTIVGVADPIKESEPKEPPETTIPHAIITRKEIDIYFSVMQKILCDEDIPKHRKRMDMMIENKTLVVVG